MLHVTGYAHVFGPRSLRSCYIRWAHNGPRRGTPPLPPTPARTRFAPSPTGYLHLGSLRTALFNYLLARKTGGQFLLRIEDTDQKRTVAGAETKLCEDLSWAGLQWDEGPGVGGPYGPYKQSERTALYQEHAQKLVDGGHAYRCFCSTQRLDDLARRREELGLPTDYDRTCAGIPKVESEDRAANGQSHVVRLLSPKEYPAYNDLVYDKVGGGKRGVRPGIMFKHGEQTFEDPVLLKSDGTPTYHLANVVDDHHMKITHVIRATEWMPSTPKHLALYKAFGWQPPQFAHVGLLVDTQGHKLSKRDMTTDVGIWRDKYGILPAAMVNFVALMGWSHKQASDIMDLQALIQEFEMRFTKGNATVAPEKLWFLQRAYATKAIHAAGSQLDMIVTSVVAEVRRRFGLETALNGKPLDEYVRAILMADSKNYDTSDRFCERNMYFFEEPQPSEGFPKDPRRYDKYFTGFKIDVLRLRKGCQQVLKQCKDDWTYESIGRSITQLVEELTSELAATSVSTDSTSHHAANTSPVVKLYDPRKAMSTPLHDFLRHRLLDGRHGPTITATMEILGYDVCKKRLLT